MQIFLDTANVDDIKKYVAWGVVDGVTTNPTLIAKEGVKIETRIKEICRIVKGPVSAEVVSEDAEGMIEEGRKFSKWHSNVYVKVPMTADGLMACKKLSSEGIRVNVTLIFSANQALLAAKAGATLVSPFIGRLDDISQDGLELIAEIVMIFKNFDIKTKVLTASIRHPRHVVEAAKIGSDIVTLPPEVLAKLIQHPLTDKGLATFMADWEKAKDHLK